MVFCWECSVGRNPGSLPPTMLTSPTERMPVGARRAPRSFFPRSIHVPVDMTHRTSAPTCSSPGSPVAGRWPGTRRTGGRAWGRASASGWRFHLREHLTLLGRGDPSRQREHPRAPLAVVVLQQADDSLPVLLRSGRHRQDFEPPREHPIPVDLDLPGPRLVGEEDDVFLTLVETVQESEDAAEGLAH